MRYNDQWSAWLLQCDDDVDNHQSTYAFFLPTHTSSIDICFLPSDAHIINCHMFSSFRHTHVTGSGCTTVDYNTVLYAGRITADIVLQWLRLQPWPDSSLYLTLICYLSNSLLPHMTYIVWLMGSQTIK